MNYTVLESSVAYSIYVGGSCITALGRGVLVLGGGKVERYYRHEPAIYVQCS